jgi:hypothetical protein
MRFRTVLMAGTLSVALASPALADRMWLLPSATTVGGTRDTVAVDAAISDTLFSANHAAMAPDAITVTQPDGSPGEKQSVLKSRNRATFDVAISRPGTWKIGFERSMIGGSFMLNGEPWRVGMRGRPAGPPGGPAGQGGPGGPAGGPPMHMVPTPADIPAGATEVKIVETLARNAVYVTAGEPTRTVFAPTGKGLDFDPVSHPDDLVSDEAATFRFLIDGKPAAGIKVEVIPGGARYREKELAQDLTTGADGLVHVKWPMGGWYWLEASAEDGHPQDSHASVRRMSFTTTLEVVAP